MRLKWPLFVEFALALSDCEDLLRESFPSLDPLWLGLSMVENFLRQAKIEFAPLIWPFLFHSP